MADAVVDNPILNRPYVAPTRHWRFDEAGITDEVVVGRRPSGYFTPVPEPRQRGEQLALQTSDRYRANEIVNDVVADRDSRDVLKALPEAVAYAKNDRLLTALRLSGSGRAGRS